MAKARARQWRRCLPTALLFGLSCTGSIDQESGGGPGGGGAGASGGTNGTGIAVRDTRLRLLTRTEYLNSVRDLLYLKDAAPAASVLPPGGVREGFDNNVEILKTDDLAIDRYDTAASAVLDAALAATNANRRKILRCDLASGDECARSIVATFARRAWRRPIESEEVDGLMTAMADAAAERDTREEGLKLALRMVLVSPNFLYRVEIDPPNATGAHPVSPYELATRLSYFLWSTTPDDPLLDAADAPGDANLGRPKKFQAQLESMLADPRSDALVDNFGLQWLGTAPLATVAPDPKVFLHYWDEELRQAMMGESRAFFRAVVKGEKAVLDLFESDTIYLNARLAKHYAMGGVAEPQITAKPAVPPQRFGLLSQAGMLTVNSIPSRGSPARRGQWVMKRLLCSPPPPPPADVPKLSEKPATGSGPTLRESLTAHMQEERCRRCHGLFDPIGFALENYDGVGRWRLLDRGHPIDATGEMEGLGKFDGPLGLSRALKQDPRFAPCFAKAAFSYALGRDGGAEGDRMMTAQISADFMQQGGWFRDLLRLVATSRAFQLREGER